MDKQDKQSRRDAVSPAHRFEAELDPALYAKARAVVADLALDRLPDANGAVRLLISASDAHRLLERGFKIHLIGSHPVAPLPAAWVMTDQQAQAWLERELKVVPRQGGK